MSLNLRQLMDIHVISHTKAVVLNLGSTDHMDFRRSVDLDKEKNTLLFSPTSNLNLAFHSIMNVGKKKIVNFSKSRYLYFMHSNTFFWEKVCRIHQTEKESMAQERLRTPCVREEHRLRCWEEGERRIFYLKVEELTGYKYLPIRPFHNLYYSQYIYKIH